MIAMQAKAAIQVVAHVVTRQDTTVAKTQLYVNKQAPYTIIVKGRTITIIY